mgnify:CR=1 FL=1
MKKIQLGGHKRGSQIRGYALVDDEYFEYLSQYKWYFHAGYAFRTSLIKKGEIKKGENNRSIKMHNVILKPPKKLYVDHIDGNGLDNRKKNLRICNVQQNAINAKIRKDNISGFKGVYWNKRRKKFCAQINKNKKRYWIGCFKTKKEAARAYNENAKQIFGEFAKVNKNI